MRAEKGSGQNIVKGRAVSFIGRGRRGEEGLITEQREDERTKESEPHR